MSAGPQPMPPAPSRAHRITATVLAAVMLALYVIWALLTILSTIFLLAASPAKAPFVLVAVVLGLLCVAITAGVIALCWRTRRADVVVWSAVLLAVALIGASVLAGSLVPNVPSCFLDGFAGGTPVAGC